MTSDVPFAPEREHSAEPLLEARGLVKRYGSRVAVRDVSLNLHSGELVALLGPNGSGKTTLMSMLVGLALPDSGAVEGGGNSCGWVPQQPAAYSRLTVRENLRLFGNLLSLDHSRSLNAASEAELDPWLDDPVWKLSGGLQQRLNIAIGLLPDPPVLILDEPTTAVDLPHRHAVWTLLRRRTEQGRSILYSTHHLDDARLADRVLVMAEGAIVHSGKLDELSIHDDPAGFPYLDDPVARGMLALWERARA